MSVTDTELALFQACSRLVEFDKARALGLAEYQVATYRLSPIQEAETWRLVFSEYLFKAAESNMAHQVAQLRAAKEQAA